MSHFSSLAFLGPVAAAPQGLVKNAFTSIVIKITKPQNRVVGQLTILKQTSLPAVPNVSLQAGRVYRN
jgi:hypothetical protein